MSRVTFLMETSRNFTLKVSPNLLSEISKFPNPSFVRANGRWPCNKPKIFFYATVSSSLCACLYNILHHPDSFYPVPIFDMPPPPSGDESFNLGNCLLYLLFFKQDNNHSKSLRYLSLQCKPKSLVTGWSQPQSI